MNKRKYEGEIQHTAYLNIPMEATFAIYDCDTTEIENIISSFNPRKATGPSSIPADILQILKKEISSPLSIIFNMSFSTGTYPNLLYLSTRKGQNCLQATTDQSLSYPI